MPAAGLQYLTDSGQCRCLHQDWLDLRDRKSKVLSVSQSSVRQGGARCFHVAAMDFLGFNAGFRTLLTGTRQQIHAGCRLLTPC